jgi:hypothetical protein
MSGMPEDGTDHYEPDHSHDGGRPRGRCRTLKDRTLPAPDSAIARVMAEIENALRLQPSGRRPQQSGAALSGLSVLGRFNSLIVDFISLFVRFISLFGRVGNLHSGVLQYQYLAGTGRVAGPPRIGLFAVFSCRPGNPIPAGLPRHQPLQPGQEVERLARAELVGTGLAQQRLGASADSAELVQERCSVPIISFPPARRPARRSSAPNAEVNSSVSWPVRR